MTYSPQINDRIGGPLLAWDGGAHASTGVGANLQCGCTTRFFIGTNCDGSISQLRFASNGCGFMVAAASVLAETFDNSSVEDLHGLARDELTSRIAAELENLPAERVDCIEAAITALRLAYSDLRSRRVEEFKGEGSLLCTCFGVSEDRLEKVIMENKLTSVEEVGIECRAGTGCGSCTMLITELLNGLDPRS